ncbi:MAG: sugar ABC transporter ATP-binding protein [Synergistaceae bacterium]|nr:sugar ABC transporter ATP-binding protein [Synergistaceae bacterium]
MEGIDKSFPGVQALSEVSFSLVKGEIHGICGENGAGKTTLMKILGGIHPQDSGTVELKRRTVRIENPLESINRRISVIYQEFNLAPTLSVAENIYLGKEPAKGPFAAVPDRNEMARGASVIMSRLGMPDLDCGQLVRNLSVAEQELVEIGKALLNNAEILIMDEPTAVLTPRETEALFKVIKSLVAEGLSVIYISHRLEEITSMCDRITVLRDGKLITVLDNSARSVAKEELVKHMVGRELNNFYSRDADYSTAEPVLEVKNLSRRGKFHNVSFVLHKGEVLGLAGLVGAGRTEIVKSIFGFDPPDEGEIFIEGQRVFNISVEAAIKNGLGYVPEDRKKEGLVLGMSLSDNIALPNGNMISSAIGWLSAEKQKSLAEHYFGSMSIRPDIPDRLARNFSGGNQQKGVIAKWLARAPKILILDEPTRGIDIGAKQEIYALISELTREGIGIIFISSEMLEVMGICDRLLIMAGGRITGEFKKGEATQEDIMLRAADLRR